MFDPEDRDSYRLNKKKDLPENNKIHIPVVVRSNDQELFNWYFRNATQVREAYGIGKNEEGKPVIVDKKKLDSLQDWEKDKVREAWKEWVKKDA